MMMISSSSSSRPSSRKTPLASLENHPPSSSKRHKISASPLSLTPPSFVGTPLSKRKPPKSSGARSDTITWRRSPHQSAHPLRDLEDLAPLAPPLDDVLLPDSAEKESLLTSWLAVEPPEALPAVENVSPPASEDGLLNLLTRLESAAVDSDEAALVEQACLEAERVRMQRVQYEQAAAATARIGWISPQSASCAPAGLLWQRFKVMQVCGQGRLLVSARPGPSPTVALALKDSWTETYAQVDDYVNVIWTRGRPPHGGELVVDDECNLLVVQPDILMSPTRVAEANSCLRRSVLQETATSSAPSEQTVLGALKHQLFQLALASDGGFALDSLRRFKAEILDKPTSAEQLFAVGLAPADADAELDQTCEQLAGWGAQVAGTRAPGLEVSFGKETSRVRLLEVAATEEMIWSPMWGLKGALDATVVLELSGPAQTHKVICPLEFKTAASPRSEHFAQVILYALLVADRYYGRPLLPSLAGLLVNMSTKDRSTKTSGVKLVHHEVRQLVLLRNSLARARAPPLPSVTSNESGDCSHCFVRDACVVHHTAFGGSPAATGLDAPALAAALSGLAAEQLRYFERWFRMLDLEEQCAVSHQQEVWTMRGAQREEAGRGVCGLRLQAVTDQDLALDRPAAVLWHELELQVGDRVLLGLEGRHLALAQGTVLSTHARGLRVKARLPELRGDDFARSEWRVDRLEHVWGLRLLKSNLFTLMQQPAARLRALVVELRPPRFWDEEDSRFIRDADASAVGRALAGCGSPEEVRFALKRRGGGAGPAGEVDEDFGLLTRDQQLALQLVLAARDWCCLLGVPGAGKTTTLAVVIKCLFRLGRSVLVTAYTHAALDNLLLKLLHMGLPVARLGHAQSIHKELQRCQLSGAELEAHARCETVIVGATCLGLVNHPLVRARRFAYCIVDEAGQITQPVALGPMMCADVAVLVGDRHQLPPLVVSDEARVLGMGTSLFEVLQQAHPQACVALQTQFRMNKDICALANALTYGGQLVCGTELVENRRLVVPRFPGDLPTSSWLHAACDPVRSVVFLDTDQCGGSKEARISGALGLSDESQTVDSAALVVNETEALVAHLIVDRLARFGAAVGEIGIISPYRAQLRVIRRRIAAEAVEVQTVDTFQGRDKACILVSLVRANADNSVGNLLLDWRRINVAFTRAKAKLVVIGSRTTLRNSQVCASFIQVCESNGWDVVIPRNGHAEFEDPLRRRIG